MRLRFGKDLAMDHYAGLCLLFQAGRRYVHLAGRIDAYEFIDDELHLFDPATEDVPNPGPTAEELAASRKKRPPDKPKVPRGWDDERPWRSLLPWEARLADPIEDDGLRREDLDPHDADDDFGDVNPGSAEELDALERALWL